MPKTFMIHKGLDQVEPHLTAISPVLSPVCGSILSAFFTWLVMYSFSCGSVAFPWHLDRFPSLNQEVSWRYCFEDQVCALPTPCLMETISSGLCIVEEKAVPLKSVLPMRMQRIAIYSVHIKHFPIIFFLLSGPPHI